MTEPASPPVAFADRRVVLCVGPGGVGKTTTAAALALTAARSGRRVAVVTIDPSRRLAQALGLTTADAPDQPLVPVWEGADGRGGRLDALLLDTKTVFDHIVQSCASSPQAAAALLRNPIYRATSEHLGGALEYAAMARLQMLYAEGTHDLIVLDTPPTANALEFLEAPRRIAELIDNPAGRILLGTGRLGGTILGLGAAVFMRALQTIGGGEFVADLGAFLREFADVVAEFHRRGGSFDDLLKSKQTGVVLTTAATEFSVREARDFLRVLVHAGLHLEGVVLNRVDPELPEPPELEELSRVLADSGQAGADALAGRMLEVYADARAQGDRARRARAELAEAFPGLKVWTAERRSPPPEGVDDLVDLGDELFAADLA